MVPVDAVLGVNEVPEIPVSVEDELHALVAELYHSTDAVFGPEYVTVAVSAAADWPTSSEKGPAGAALTVGSAKTVTFTAFDAEEYDGSPLSNTTAQ